MNTLEHARNIIDEIDRQMAELFERRMQAVEQVIAYKWEHGLPILDAGREQQVIERNCKRIEKKEYEPFYIDYIRALMEISKRYQRTLVNRNKIGYQGTEGAFQHIAVRRLFGDAQGVTYATFEEVFRAVQDGEIAYGVIPFENSYTGEVGEVLDLLWKYDCYITDIYDLRIHQNLLVNHGATMQDIRQVYSMHQALSQCQDFLSNHDFEVVPYPNTALAAKYVKESGDVHKAAIASEEAAELYDLDVLVRNINTSAENTTRFIVIGRGLPQGGNRFNVLFTVSHDPGQLAKIMQLVGSLGFNLESIKSRPLRNEPWQYYFYMEVVGNLGEQKSKELIEQLRANCKEVKILGGYTV